MINLIEMIKINGIISVFMSSFFLDFFYVLWIRSRDPWKLASLSGIIAIFQIIGLGGAIKGHPVAYILWYVTGSFAVGLLTFKKKHNET